MKMKQNKTKISMKKMIATKSTQNPSLKKEEELKMFLKRSVIPNSQAYNQIFT